MTVLSSGLTPNHRPTGAEFRHIAYLANGWDRLQKWDGRGTALETAGIAGPSRDLDSWTPSPTEAAGDCEVGVHVVRYRYMDSRTGAVSDPSEEREVEVTSTKGQLTFSIDDSGAAHVIRSTDTKVDRIILEMTTLGSSVFFKAGEALNSASTLVVSVSDAQLEQQLLLWDETGHSLPPVAKNVVSHMERLWLFSQVEHAVGTASFTNASVDVDEGSTDPDWRTSALGSSSTDRGSVTWLIQKEGDARAYEIDYYDSGNNKIVLRDAYAGTTEANANYRIFSRSRAIWVSRPGFPESFEPLKFLTEPQGQLADDVVAGLGYGSSMLFWSTTAMFKIAWETDPLVDPLVIPLSGHYGALNQHVVIEVEGSVYALGRLGITGWRGLVPKLLSAPLMDTIQQIDWSKSDNFHCCFFPESRCVRWFVCYTGDSSNYPQRYLQLDVDTGAWGTGRYYQPISYSRLVPREDQPLTPVYGDEHGHTWIADTGVADGVVADYTHLTASSTSPSTTTLVVVDETLPVDGVGLDGCYLYHLDSGEARRITANTADSITVASAFSSAPAAGDTLWVGPIPAKLRTKAFRARLRGKKTRSIYLWLEFTPCDEARYLQVRVYEDLSTTAKSWAAARNNLDGSLWPGSDDEYPGTDWLVDMSESDGNVQLPLSAEWRRYFEIELEILEPDADFELIGLEHNGSSTGDEAS